MPPTKLTNASSLRKIVAPRLLALASIVLTIAIWYAYAYSLSNRFRYAFSLETGLTLLFGTAAIATGLFTVTRVLFVRVKDFDTLRLLSWPVFVMFVFATCQSQALGPALPDLSPDHIVTSKSGSVEAWGHRFVYSLQLRNPFSDEHQEVLLISGAGRNIELPLNLYERRLIMFAGPTNKLDDWIQLEPKTNSGEFQLNVGWALRPATFAVDVESQKVQMLWAQPECCD